jgi:glycosyltransferase involved in cell wall biosynthesis
MRLLFVTASLEAGGAERHWQRLLTGLTSRGHQASMLAVGAEGPLAQEFRSVGIEVIALGMSNRLDVPRLARALGKIPRSPDLIVSKDTSGMCIAALAGLLLRAPHIYNDHDPIGYILLRRRERLARLIAPTLTGVVLISDRQRDRWTARRVAPDRLQTIANGVDAPEPASRRQMRESLGLQEDTIAVTLIATLRPEKRVADFVGAVRAARHGSPNVVGLVVGGGQELPLLREQVGDDRGFRVLGHREDVSAVLQASDICVLTSSMEVQPMAVLEAMACGLPVVATDVGDLDRLVADGITGWLVAVGDVQRLGECIARLAGDRAQRRAFGHASLTRWEQNWQAGPMVQRYEAVLEAARRGSAPVRRRKR